MENEKKETESSGTNTNEGSELSTNEQTERANAAAERLEKATEEARKYGVADAGQGSVKKEMTDSEYRKDVERRLAEGEFD